MNPLWPTDELGELAAVVDAVLARHADSQAVRAAMASPTGYDADLWRLLCEQVGVAALAVPEAHGGAGASAVETAVVLERLGRSLAPSPLLGTWIVAEALLASGDTDTCGRLLPRIADGDVATLAWAGPSGLDADEPLTLDDGRVSGTVAPVLFGDQAQVLLAVAGSPEGPVLLEVDPSAVSATWTPAMDPTLRLATLTFAGAPARVVASGDAARAALDRARLAGVVGTAALQVGCAERGLAMTVAHTRERTQFGRPLGSFQALKHRMADLLVLLEMSRSASWSAAEGLASAAPDAARRGAVAASYCGDALQRIAAETVQLHGGLAITWEHDAQLVFKRAHALGVLFGQPHEHRRGLVDPQQVDW